MNILIVEDNRHMRRVLGEMMRAAFPACSVLEAATGSSAMALCQTVRPELVLMDVGLPDDSGINLTARIKAMAPEATVVIVSSHRSAASQDAADADGAAAFVFKDDVYETLLSTVTRALGARRRVPRASS